MAKPNPAQTNNTKKSIAEIMDLKKPVEAECTILLHPEYQEQIRQLEQEKMQARSRGATKDISQPGVEKIQAKIDALLEEAQEYNVTFRFRGIPRKKLDELARAHPPTKEQTEEYKRLGAPGTLEFNVDTFGPALVSTTCIDPEMSLEDATRIFDEWGAGDIDQLFSTALSVARGRASLPLSRRGTDATSTSD